MIKTFEQVEKNWVYETSDFDTEKKRLFSWFCRDIYMGGSDVIEHYETQLRYMVYHRSSLEHIEEIEKLIADVKSLVRRDAVLTYEQACEMVERGYMYMFGDLAKGEFCSTYLSSDLFEVIDEQDVDINEYGFETANCLTQYGKLYRIGDDVPVFYVED